MALVFGFIVLAVVAIAMAVWQPWNANPPTSNTVIHEAPQRPPDNNTTIVVPSNPGSTEPPKNEVNIENHAPAAEPPATTGEPGSGTSEPPPDPGATTGSSGDPNATTGSN